MQMQCKQAMDAWSSLRLLSTNAIIPSTRGRYAIARAYDKLLPTIKRLEDEHNNIIKKYCELDPKTKISTGLKEGYTQEDFDAEFKEFSNMEIDIDVYKVKLSDLDEVKIPREKGDDIPLPPIHLSALKDYIDETEEPKKESPVKVVK